MARRIYIWLAAIVVVIVLLVAAALTALRFASQAREVDGRVTAAPATGRFIAGGDVNLFVQESGPAAGVPVVLIHGVGAWSETWRDSIDALAQAGYRVVAIDMPPFGYSFRPTDRDYSTEAQARRILAALDALSIDSAVLVGHSFGGRATVEAAMRAPQRVRALVLVSAALGLQDPPGDASLLAHLLLDARMLRNALVASIGTNPWLTETVLRSFTRRHDALTPGRVALYQRPQRVTGSTEAMGDWLQQFMLSGERPASRQPLRYREIAIPTLVIWGAEDTVTPPAQAQHLVKLLPGATLATLPGTGHIPQLEDERAFNALLLQGLSVLAPAWR